MHLNPKAKESAERESAAGVGVPCAGLLISAGGRRVTASPAHDVGLRLAGSSGTGSVRGRRGLAVAVLYSGGVERGGQYPRVVVPVLVHPVDRAVHVPRHQLQRHEAGARPPRVPPRRHLRPRHHLFRTQTLRGARLPAEPWGGFAADFRLLALCSLVAFGSGSKQVIFPRRTGQVRRGRGVPAQPRSPRLVLVLTSAMKLTGCLIFMRLH